MIIGIGGVSRSGKTYLADQIAKGFPEKSVVILHQDDFVKPKKEIPQINGRVDWEHPGSMDFYRLTNAIGQATGDLVIVEGILAFYDDSINQLYDRKIFLSIEKEIFLARKAMDQRWGLEETWFVEHIWQSHLKYGLPKNLDNYQVIDGTLNTYDIGHILML